MVYFLIMNRGYKLILNCLICLDQQLKGRLVWTICAKETRKPVNRSSPRTTTTAARRIQTTKAPCPSGESATRQSSTKAARSESSRSRAPSRRAVRMNLGLQIPPSRMSTSENWQRISTQRTKLNAGMIY